MTAVNSLKRLCRDVYRAMEAEQVATAQLVTGDREGAAQTIQEAWKPLNDVPPSMIEATGGKIISLMRD